MRPGRCGGLRGADGGRQGTQPVSRDMLAQLGELVAFLVAGVGEYGVAQQDDTDVEAGRVDTASDQRLEAAPCLLPRTCTVNLPEPDFLPHTLPTR
jgi:hypothetical protein